MEDADIEEAFAALGRVTIRRMFGGKGVYHGGLIVAVVLGGELRVKGDALSAPALEAEGARRWTYARPGRKPVAMPYWSLPEAAWDDPEAMARWAREAYAAALRAPPPARRRRSAAAQGPPPGV